MKRVRIKVEMASIEVGERGSVLCPIWIEIGDIAFPEVGWFDFPVALLTWWIKELDGLLSGHSSADLRFMDGPMVLRICRDSEGHIARLLQHEREVRPGMAVDAEELRNSARVEAVALVRSLRTLSLWSTEVDELARLVGEKIGRQN